METIDNDKSKGIEVQKEKLKDLQEGMDQLSPLMDAVKETGDDLIRLSGPGAGSDNVTQQVKSLEERWGKLSTRVQEKGVCKDIFVVNLHDERMYLRLGEEMKKRMN